MKEEEEGNGSLNAHFVVFKRTQGKKRKEQFITHIVSNRNTLAEKHSAHISVEAFG